MIQASSPLDIRRPQRRGGGAGSFAPLRLVTVTALQCVCLAALRPDRPQDALHTR